MLIEAKTEETLNPYASPQATDLSSNGHSLGHIKSFSAVPVVLCTTATLMLLVSLMLPSVMIALNLVAPGPKKPVDGMLCLMIGVYWYPSNLLLLLAPLAATATKRIVVWIFLVMFVLTLVANTFLALSLGRDALIGFWVWTLAYLVALAGLILRIIELKTSER